ncbi:MAG: pimeloyl-ACP methyl ester carboxylesterase [Alphaproteobacteria bacterium]|jgi:pimeloyl-ACP methyl ester carboxylesterase
MSDIWSQAYTAHKDGVDLHVWRKRVGAPKAGDARPVLFLVHGSSFSGRSGFDLQVPGKPDYSMMDHFARLGFDTWTMDHEGYGRSGLRDGIFSYVMEGVDDLNAAMAIVEAETGASSVVMYGGSSGALRAAAYAAACPDRVDRLAIAAMVYTGKGSPTLAKRAEKIDVWKSSNKRPVDHAFFSTIFNRDKPGTSEDVVALALADSEAPLCTHVPTGTYIDMCVNLPLVEPEDVKCPTVLVRSEHDGIATDEDVMEFFIHLPNKDKQFTMMDGQSHAATLGLNRHRFWHVLHTFLSMPAKEAV